VSNYAEWRPLPELSPEERETLRSRRRFPTQLRFVSAALLIVGLLLVTRESSDIGMIGLVMSICALVLMLAPLDKSRPSLLLKLLAERFRGRPHHAVKVTIYKDWKKIGEDQGVVTFDKAMLIYEGVQTNFALGRGDVFLPEETLEKPDARFCNLPAGLAWGFKLADDPSIRLSFQSFALGTSDYISGALAKWLQSDEMAGGIRVLPPNVPLPK
jgi:hypothetical protein